MCCAITFCMRAVAFLPVRAEFPIPQLSSELEQFLSSPQNLPIHDFRQTQRFWHHDTNPDSLFAAVTSPLHTDISLVRESSSGTFVDYCEDGLDEVGLTAKNSTSLHRLPAPPSLSVKGEPTSYPFWPGGFENPIIDEINKVDDPGTKDYNLFDDLLTSAPGMSGGILFSRETKPESPGTVPTNVDLSEMLFGADTMIKWPDPVLNSQDIKTKSTLHKVEEKGEQAMGGQLEGVLAAAVVAVEHPSRPPEVAGTKDTWAVRVDTNKPGSEIPNMALEFPFTLDNFQKRAVEHLEQHDDVFVAAHTSAGKTLVAEYAIALSRNHHTRVIYTSPIKALSNQKFRDFRSKFGEDGVGLITGDVQLKTEAPCLIMTTEILRSMLYNGSDVIRDVEWVVFDEVHYINDSERGVVWEEVLIMLPEHISIIMLSATVPNAMKFADWVGRTKKRNMFVISTSKRPVPLRHYVYTGNSKQTSNELFEIVSKQEIDKQSYSNALRALKDREKKSASQFGPKSRHYVNPKQERNIWMSLIGALQKKDKLPIIAFTFSRKRCDENANSLTTLDLLSTSTEKSEVHVFFQRCMMRLKGTDSKLPQIMWMRDLLKRGIAVHHSGILPILKEVIELLFQRGLVRLLFATETFAMGVNMPARTVIFDSNRKHDGVRTRDLNPGEYIQMAGRAGRRGLDADGTVILLCKCDVPELSDLKTMILGKPTSLESQFRLTYSMLLNLTRVETLKVKDMMKRSFAEIDSVRNENKHTTRLERLKEELSSMECLDCSKCAADIEQYYEKCSQITHLHMKLQESYLSFPQVAKALQPGRVVTVYISKYGYALAVVLQLAPAKLTVLLLCNAEDEEEAVVQSLIDATEIEMKVVHVHHCFDKLHLPDPPLKHAVVVIPSLLLINITQNMIKIDSLQVINDYKRRQIPRFREDQPIAGCVRAMQELSRLADNGCPVLEPKIGDMQYIERADKKRSLEEALESCCCTHCPQFKDHFDIIRQKSELQKEISDLTFQLSDGSLQFQPDYKSRIYVLKKLSYISDHGTIELKGRVACELHTQEVLVTELLFQNVLSGMEPAEIAALLSCIVFQQAKCSEPKLSDTLKKGKQSIIEVATQIATLEEQCGLNTSIDDSLAELHFGLVEVVYEWACGKEFVDIVTLTDVSEGMIVRCIQRLDETCKDVRNAARVIGDSSLYNKMQTSSTLIKRDIVFAASLYLQ